MRDALLRLLRCLVCRGKLEVTSFSESRGGEEVVDGVLACSCQASYPIVYTIPRMLPNAYGLFPEFCRRYADLLRSFPHEEMMRRHGEEFDGLQARTRDSFGYQWTSFSDMVCDFRENFLNYLSPAPPEFFRGRLGLDAGCGFGRHLYQAASCGAEMVGVDFSRAIESAHKNTKHLPNIHLVQADIYALPFVEGAFDFVYCIGVLHHLPDPDGGAKALALLVRPNGTLFIWVYSKERRVTISFLETLRALTTRLPHPLVNGMSFLGAALDRYCLISPYQILRRVPGVRTIVERVAPGRVKMYSAYPFQVLHADWFDRLAAPIRFYYDECEVEQLMRSAGTSEVRVTPTGLYGWRACGIRL